MDKLIVIEHMDKVFGNDKKEIFRNELIWSYRSGGASKYEYLPRKHDTCFLYSKTNQGEAFKRLENLELVNFVKSLPERQRDVIMLFYFFDLLYLLTHFYNH